MHFALVLLLRLVSVIVSSTQYAVLRVEACATGSPTSTSPTSQSPTSESPTSEVTSSPFSESPTSAFTTSPVSSSPTADGSLPFVICNRWGKRRGECIKERNECRWISRTRFKKACERDPKFGSLRACISKCQGDFGCHGMPGRVINDVCHYRCEPLCRADKLCVFQNNQCSVKPLGGRRSLMQDVQNVENRLRAVERAGNEAEERVLITPTCNTNTYETTQPATFFDNVNCETPCQSGVCRCGCNTVAKKDGQYCVDFDYVHSSSFIIGNCATFQTGKFFYRSSFT